MAKPGAMQSGDADELDDRLEGAPPQPSGKTRMSSMPKGSADSERSASGALSLMGLQPVERVISDMGELENIVKRLSRYIPALSTAAAPFIAQMRDLGAAALADIAQGGSGGVNLGGEAPPPMLPGQGGQPGMGGAPGPGGMGPGAMPPGMLPPPPG